MKKIITWLIILLVIVFSLYFIFNKNTNLNNKNNNVATTAVDQEQKLLDIVTKDWIATTTISGYSYKYPKDFGTTYLQAFDWPPVLSIDPKTYSCISAGKSTILPGGETKSKTINGQEYCITTETEGAAGSTYTNQAYAFAYQDQTLILTFTTRQPQCMNYDDPKQTECLQEENTFQIDQIIDTITKTIKANN